MRELLKFRNLSKLIIATGLVFAAILGYLFISYYENPGPLQDKKVVYIEKGSSLSAISAKLAEEGIIDLPWLFQVELRLRGLSKHVRAGEFEFQPQMSPDQVYTMLAKGAFVQHGITIPEGTRSKDAIKLLQDAALLFSENLGDIKEGELLPETYYYTRNEPASAVLARMRHAMHEVVEQGWSKHKDGHPLKSPQEVIIMASIVEKETGVGSERSRVAAVFLNRLKKGMLLQSDPTVIYGIEYELGRPVDQLSKADLHTPSTYNTYLNAGLPPTPICNPGRAAIEAVLNPAQTEDLYFVADGTGGHVFARTYDEHRVNHQKWRKIRDR